MNIYFAAPLFNIMERDRNLEDTLLLEQAGFTVFLPQRDAGELIKTHANAETYGADITALKACDIVVAILDGAHVDEGVAFEVGYASALGKRIVLIKNDVRCFSATSELNNMFFACEIAANVAQWIGDNADGNTYRYFGGNHV